MRTIDILEHLKHGELANSFTADGLLDPAQDKGRVFSYINRALTELNKEFFINQAELIINLVENRSKYFVTSNGVLKVLNAYKSDGTELALNNENDHTLSIFTPDVNTIEYYGENKATDTVEDYISIIYLKHFTPIKEDLDILPLSEVYLDSILAYVGYIAQHSSGMTKDNDSSFLKATYLESLRSLERLGYTQDNADSTERLGTRGFV